MKIIKQYWEWMIEPNGEDMLRHIEQAGRLCYKSEDRITETSHKNFVRKAIGMGHHSIIEHVNCSVRIITDRGVTHEIVRHRIASYSQESTRYCNYGSGKFGNEITVILPVQFYEENRKSESGRDSWLVQYNNWETACKQTEHYYMLMLQAGSTPQEARAVLPNSLKTEIIMTANVREWRHFFTLRCSNKAHPQMRELARSIHKGFIEKIPVIFDDVQY